MEIEEMNQLYYTRLEHMRLTEAEREHCKAWLAWLLDLTNQTEHPDCEKYGLSVEQAEELDQFFWNIWDRPEVTRTRHLAITNLEEATHE